MEAIEYMDIKVVLPYFLKHKNVWTSYDEQADVLYVRFKENAVSDDSEMTDDDLIIRYEDGEVVGITVLNASKRK
ncbi:DUF2283 domain-containing protein [Algoriphagus sp. H41]|uniref:DUF2283 domain-containing protein n=1 Tax=Algoriphagus oliviformis TaxID=2811231 RepID=A0ABS3C1I6_9BACT|nr:DUF2283 domain-containing protein [Algoriphagus oliviformis]MBN7810449.1 DUF2283 domain-containing protein [Algoriphagus oliviformis]